MISLNILDFGIKKWTFIMKFNNDWLTWWILIENELK